MKQIKSIEVFYHGTKVGTLSEYKERLTAFQYTTKWLSDGFSISPFTLPLTEKVYFSNLEPFDGLFGVFEDCLPDGWGRLLTDRMLRSNGIEPESLNNITRLSLLGANSKGALEFVPCQLDKEDNSSIDFDNLYEQCTSIFDNIPEVSDYYDLFSMAGSSGGARPKAYVLIEGQPWIVKFPTTQDGSGIGQMEYRYNCMAKQCGISTAEFKLLPSGKTPGFFASRRFDRKENGERIHMISAGGLLEVSHRFPMLDYSHLLKLTNILTKDIRETQEMYRLMCFNEMAHNRDDHAKNFSFLFDETKSRWTLSPAYDLTYSNSVNGEHATTINGNGRNPSEEDLIKVGTDSGLDRAWCRDTLETIKEAVPLNLSLSVQDRIALEDIMHARAERNTGFRGFDAETVLREMDGKITQS